MIDYAAIKAMAKEQGCSYRNFIAQAPQNDPFYCGTKTDIATAEWFADVWQRGGFGAGAHLRRIHYWIVSQETPLLMHNGKPYENTQTCWEYLGDASLKARYLNLVPASHIADHRAPDPYIHADYDDAEIGFYVEPPEIADPYFNVYGFNECNVQPYHLEVWCEKSTMDDVLVPVCKRYKANYVTGVGEMSVAACVDLVQGRLPSANKPARIFYISDFDPAGESMPRAVSRKVEWLIRGGVYADVKLTPLVLTREQVEEYRLPRTPIKEKERRAAAFEKRHGKKGAVELDALEALRPGVLDHIVRDALREYYSEEAAAAAYEKKQKLRFAVTREVEAITARYQPEIAALENMCRELESIEIPNIEDYAPEQAEPTVDDGAHRWLYDANRSYLEQIRAYKSHHRQGEN